MRTVFLALAVALTCGSVAAQTTLWSAAEYGVAASSNTGSGGYASKQLVAFAPDGSIFAASTTRNGMRDDVALVRFSPAGTRQWLRLFNNRFDEDDRLQSLGVDAGANASITSIHLENTETRAVTSRYAPDGTLRWSYLHPHNGIASFAAHAVDAQGNIAVAVSGADVSVSLLSPNGVPLWHWTTPDPSFLDPPLVAFDASGSVYVVHAGMTVYAKLHVHKLSPGGTLLWSDEYSVPSAYVRPAAVAVDPSGNLLVAGVQDADALLIKFASGGGMQWQRVYNGPANNWDRATGVGVDAGGNAVIAGRTDDLLGLVARYAADGTLLWTRTLANVDWIAGVRVDPSGDVVVAGRIAENSTTHTIARRYTAAGGTAWTQTFQPASPDFNLPADVAYEPGGAVVIIGQRLDAPSTAILVWSLAGATGTTAWSTDNPLQGADLASDFSSLLPARSLVALDGGGNVAMASNAFNGKWFEAVAAKYAPDGARLWRVAHASATGHAYAGAVAVDAGGGVVMTGSQPAALGGTFDLFVNRYDANGALLWSRTHPAAGGRFVGVDAGGNVYVAGNVETGSTLNVLLLKYGPTGTPLWSRTYRNPAEYATIDGFALDASGQPVLADAEPNRVRLVKYSSAGAILWEFERMPQSGFGALDMQLDAAGNAYFVYGTELVKVASTGLFAWVSPGRFDARLAVSPAGEVFVAGRSHVTSGVDKFASDGTWLWSYFSPNLYEASGIAVDAQGHAIVTGVVGVAPDTDVATVKIATQNGALLWQHEYVGSAGGRDRGHAVRTSGDAVYVAATTRESGMAESARLIKIANPGDTTPPDTTITLAPPDPSPTNEVMFTFTSNEPVAQFECSMDGATFFTCTSPARRVLTLGTHTFQVRAQDRGGNIDPTPATHTFTVTRFVPLFGVYASPPGTVVGAAAQIYAEIYGSPSTPTGTVDFRFGSQSLPGCAAAPLSPSGFGSYFASCSYAGFAAGKHLVQARYSGDSVNTAVSADTVIDVNMNPSSSCGGFSDVSAFCNDVAWIANRNVTLGCTATLYCPDAPVSRLAMAAFMNRLGRALTPQTLWREEVRASIDPDASALVCGTGDLDLESAPRSLLIDAVAAAVASQPVVAEVEVVFSQDFGTTWIPTFHTSRLGAAPGRWSNIRLSSQIDFGAEEPIRVALRVKRSASDIGSAGFTTLTCNLRARVNNATE